MSFIEGDLSARLISPDNTREVNLFQHLRFEYYVRQKRWVCPLPDTPLQEHDRYDAFAQHLGVFAGEELVAYLRLLSGQAECGFMLDHEFDCLLPDTRWMALERTGAVELSRLVVAPGYRMSRTSGGAHVVELLLKMLYHLAQQQGITHFYIVVEEQWLKPFARRFSMEFTPLGPAYTFPDGTKTVAAHASLVSLEQAVAYGNPGKYHWYSRPSSTW